MLSNSKAKFEEQRNANLQKINNLISNITNKIECNHYIKKCHNFLFSCCNKRYDCHRCHNEVCDKKFVLETITCIECNLEQEPSNKCIGCSIDFSKSYCFLCKIWTDKEIYHCDECEICRVGKKDENYHCDKCCLCYQKSNNLHNCSKNYLKNDFCVYCMESLHTSQKSTITTKCLHSFHYECHNQSNRIKCPICIKSLIDMKTVWRNKKSSIINNPIPHGFLEYHVGNLVKTSYGKFLICSIKNNLYFGRLKSMNAYAVFNKDSLYDIYQNIYCYDCEQKSETLFHYYGLECNLCESFNTVKN